MELTENTGPATLQCLLHDDVLVAPDDVSFLLDSVRLDHRGGDWAFRVKSSSVSICIPTGSIRPD